jgi:hypothetical protein
MINSSKISAEQEAELERLLNEENALLEKQFEEEQAFYANASPEEIEQRQQQEQQKLDAEAAARKAQRQQQNQNSGKILGSNAFQDWEQERLRNDLFLKIRDTRNTSNPFTYSSISIPDEVMPTLRMERDSQGNLTKAVPVPQEALNFAMMTPDQQKAAEKYYRDVETGKTYRSQSGLPKLQYESAQAYFSLKPTQQTQVQNAVSYALSTPERRQSALVSVKDSDRNYQQKLADEIKSQSSAYYAPADAEATRKAETQHAIAANSYVKEKYGITDPDAAYSKPTIIKALAPGQDVGGTKTVITNDVGSYFVESTQQGPKISVATQTGGTRTSDNATNITPIVNYNTSPSFITNSSIINQNLADQAKQVQELITGSLVRNIYSGMASQTTRPEYTIDNQIGPDLRVYQNDIKEITPLVPITQENIDKKVTQDLERQKYAYTKVLKEAERQGDLALEVQNKNAEEELEKQRKQNQWQLDKQTKTNAEIEAKRIADAKAAAEARLRASQQFEYDAAIEAALKAASGNNSLARRQFAAHESRQKTMDAERLAQMRAKRGNPTGYAGGFAEKAIQKTPAAPAAIKAPAMAKPQTPEPIEPANKVTSSFLPPKVDGLQFGGN